MLSQKEIQKIASILAKKFPTVLSIIQFGSSVSGDFTKFSDTDIAVIIKDKKSEKKVRDFCFSCHSAFELQIHLFSSDKFINDLKKGMPLALSILYTGRAIYGKERIQKLKRKNYLPNNFTKRACMLNSFAALSLAVSDLTNGMLADSLNSAYHAARSSIWAVLMDRAITPQNKEALRLIADKKIKLLYKRILGFRAHPPDYGYDIALSQDIYKKGNINEYTQLLEDATYIVKKNYRKIFNRNFIGLFEVLEILNKRYKSPSHYSIYLLVDWEKEKLLYMVFLSVNSSRIFLNIDVNSGKVCKARG